jgi:hypothetical protein
MNLPRDLVAMLSEFAAAAVRYLIVGGHAVGVHARPRTTKDVDVWLDPGARNVGRACRALLAFGIPASLVEDLRTAQPDEIVWMGRAPARVDFLLALPGVDFGPAWERRVDVRLDGVLIHVIGRDDLLANKRAVGRPQDRRDVRAIDRAHAAALRPKSKGGQKAR